MEILFAVLAMIVIGLAINSGGEADHDSSLQNFLNAFGWKQLHQNWNPHLPGWLPEEKDKDAFIIYEDKAGNHHRANVKVSHYGKVDLTNDVIVKPAEPKEDLQLENQRLRERIAELESRDRSE